MSGSRNATATQTLAHITPVDPIYFILASSELKLESVMLEFKQLALKLLV
jgi:hypothetical protein